MGEVDRLGLLRHYDCPSCAGTGSIESSDSTDDRWWDCSRCDGTGKLEDRRRPDPQLQGAVSPERIAAVIRAARARRRSDLADAEITWIAAAVAAHFGGQ